MGIGFSAPQYLLLLALIAPVLLLARRRGDGLSSGRRRFVTAMRCAQIALLTFALAGFRVQRGGDGVAVVFAIDGSRSVDETRRAEALSVVREAVASMRPEDRAGLVVFGGAPLVESLPVPRPDFETLQSVAEPDLTDLAAALRLATSLYPEGTRRRLVLFSDGNENRGDALEAVRELRAAGVVADVATLSSRVEREVSIARMDAPARVERGEALEVRVEALSTDAGPATLRLFRDGAPLGRREVELHPGRNVLVSTWIEEEAGFHTYEARIESPLDARPENNVAGAFVEVSGPSRILLAGAPDRNAALLRALEGTRLGIESAAEVPSGLARMKAYDAIVLNDVPAEALDPATIEALENYVRVAGGGLGMIGGENSFAPGGWVGTPVERALPVSMELKAKEQFPALGMVMVIDKSGSMSGSGSARGSKLEIAARAAIEAVNLLGPRDRVGVVGFDSAAQWVSKLGPAADRARIHREILSMQPGGGTDAYQGMSLGFEALRGADARLKHMLLLSDGQTPPSAFPELVEKMRAAGITLSCVSIGTDADERFLAGLARDGGGRFYSCPDPSRVPRIFVRETILVQRAYLNEETEFPTIAASHPAIDDPNLNSTPPLHGRVVTEIKPRAETLLRLKTDPLLATWEYGLGHSFAFTSDAFPRWARDWVGWDGFGVFWERLLRWSLRSVASADLHPRIEFERGRGRLTLDAVTPEGERLNFLDLAARVVRPDQSVMEIPLRQTAVGTYEAEFEAETPGAYFAGVADASGRRATAGGMVAFSPELEDFGPDTLLLHEIARMTGGRIDPEPETMFRREGAPVMGAREPILPLLVAAAILLLIEVAVRRVTIDDETRAWARDKWTAFATRFRRKVAGAETDSAAGLPGGLKGAALSARVRLRRDAESEGRESAGGGASSGASASPGGSVAEGIREGGETREAPGARPPAPGGVVPPRATSSASTPAPRETSRREAPPREAPSGPESAASALRDRLAKARRGGPQETSTPDAAPPAPKTAPPERPAPRERSAPPPREGDGTIDASKTMSDLLSRKRDRRDR